MESMMPDADTIEDIGRLARVMANYADKIHSQHGAIVKLGRDTASLRSRLEGKCESTQCPGIHRWSEEQKAQWRKQLAENARQLREMTERLRFWHDASNEHLVEIEAHIQMAHVLSVCPDQ
jgi:hypothetical protein